MARAVRAAVELIQPKAPIATDVASTNYKQTYATIRTTDVLPPWALSILRRPHTLETLMLDGDRLVTAAGVTAGILDQGIVRMPVSGIDESIAVYRKMGGAHFHERAQVPFAMSSLDTPIYHHHLRAVRPPSDDAIIVDVGGGDGRNAWMWLREVRCKIVVIDAAGEALIRFRQRVSAESDEMLDRLLLIEADARALPLATEVADTVFSIEALYYLNEDYGDGLDECARILSNGGQFLVSDRDYECGLLMRLLYHGIEGMLESAETHSLWDGTGTERIRTRSFTEAELVALVEARGLTIRTVHGTPAHSLVLGWLNNNGKLNAADERLRPDVDMVLHALANDGRVKRCHVISAVKP